MATTGFIPRTPSVPRRWNLPSSCLYSSIPVFQIDENGRTATFIFHQKLPSSLYTNVGGDVERLANG